MFSFHDSLLKMLSVNNKNVKALYNPGSFFFFSRTGVRKLLIVFCKRCNTTAHMGKSRRWGVGTKSLGCVDNQDICWFFFSGFPFWPTDAGHTISSSSATNVSPSDVFLLCLPINWPSREDSHFSEFYWWHAVFCSHRSLPRPTEAGNHSRREWSHHT